MGDIRSALAEVKPRLAALVDELVGKGADRLSILYVIEKEVAALRDGPQTSVAAAPADRSSGKSQP